MENNIEKLTVYEQYNLFKSVKDSLLSKANISCEPIILSDKIMECIEKNNIDNITLHFTDIVLCSFNLHQYPKVLKQNKFYPFMFSDKEFDITKIPTYHTIGVHLSSQSSTIGFDFLIDYESLHNKGTKKQCVKDCTDYFLRINKYDIDEFKLLRVHMGIFGYPII